MQSKKPPRYNDDRRSCLEVLLELEDHIQNGDPRALDRALLKSFYMPNIATRQVLRGVVLGTHSLEEAVKFVEAELAKY